MLEKNNISENKIALLSDIDLPKVVAAVGRIIAEICASKHIAIFFWDEDLEALSNAFTFGIGATEASFLKEFAEQFQRSPDIIYAVQADDYNGSLLPEWHPLLCYQVSENNQLYACILFSNTAKRNTKEILADLRAYPLTPVLKRSWDFYELQNENRRLRSSYEDMENKTRVLEEQTRKLIQDLTMRDAIRTKHVERERLIYSISNVVRSYVDIQKVLETTVEKIGSTFAVSRCLLIRSVPKESNGEAVLQVLEYTNDAAGIKHVFDSPEGSIFAQTAFALGRAQELEAPFSTINAFNSDFLKKLDFRSGLLIPLLLREQSLGILFLQDRTQPRQWNIDDISLIESLADQISVAIENAELHLEQERQAITDGLTGIANRRSFNKTLAREFERAKRYEQDLSLIVIDLDYLKAINDNFGHQIGDEAIKSVAQVLRQSSRAIDLAARFGGEEFCLLLPNTELAMAEQLGERLRKLISEIQIKGPGYISASLGIASFPLHASDSEALFKAADEALYEAKLSGRNRVRVAGIKDKS